MALCSKDIMFSAAGGLRTLFADVYKSAENSGNIFNCLHAEIVSLLYRAFECAFEPENEQNCCDAVNAVVRLTPGRTLLEVLEDDFFEMLIVNRLDIVNYLKKSSMEFAQIEFYRNNFLDVENGIAELRKLFDNKRINPAANGCFGGRSVLHDAPEKIVEIALLRDPFAHSRTFRYVNGNFYSCNIKPVPVKKFFGFCGVREQFRNHLQEFSAGVGNVPLLISSLPGLGKTQFSIAYALDQENVTLIFAEPESLETLDELIGRLALRKRRRFAVFFDDIEPDRINWYSFRTNVGGSAALPENIMFILASNFQFPINILSRGREITFPVFDEVRCLEMIEDFLADCGMRSVQENLASVIAAGYIEDFGQKKFTELSPRTLMRYLEKFRKDGALRRKMLEMSRQEMIVRPDAQLFYEFNIKLLRSLYGESYIDALREEKLRELSS